MKLLLLLFIVTICPIGITTYSDSPEASAYLAVSSDENKPSIYPYSDCDEESDKNIYNDRYN